MFKLNGRLRCVWWWNGVINVGCCQQEPNLKIDFLSIALETIRVINCWIKRWIGVLVGCWPLLLTRTFPRAQTIAATDWELNKIRETTVF